MPSYIKCKMYIILIIYICKNFRPSAAHIYALALKPITNDAHNPVYGERSTQPMLLQTYNFSQRNKILVY